MVGVAQLVERRVVVADVAGSSPVVHPSARAPVPGRGPFVVPGGRRDVPGGVAPARGARTATVNHGSVLDPRPRGSVHGLNSREVSRAVARAEAGKPVDVREVSALLAARDGELRAADGRRAKGQGRRARRGRTRRCGDLLAQGVHPADAAVPGPVPLLHVRDGSRQAGCPVPLPGRGAGDRPRGGGARLQGGACSRSATVPRTGGPRPGPGWRRRATTRRSSTYGPWRSGSWRRPGCCRTSTRVSCPGPR